MQKKTTITRETAVKNDKAGKIGKNPHRKDKVADDIRGSLKTEKVEIKLQTPVANGLLKLAGSIKGLAKPDSPLMKSLKTLESGIFRVEQVRKPATKIAKKAISDISDLPDVKQSLLAVKQSLATAKKELTAAVKANLEEIEKKIRESNPSEFDDIKERLRKFTEDLEKASRRE